MRKYILTLVILGALLLPIGAAEATPPTLCEGSSWIIEGPHLISLRVADSKWIIESWSSFETDGCLEGVIGGVVRIVMDEPNGDQPSHLTIYGQRYFEGTLFGEYSGRIEVIQVGNGYQPGILKSSITILSGTDDFENLRGQGKTTFSLPDNTGTYSLQVHFEP